MNCPFETASFNILIIQEVPFSTITCVTWLQRKSCCLPCLQSYGTSGT